MRVSGGKQTGQKPYPLTDVPGEASALFKLWVIVAMVVSFKRTVGMSMGGLVLAMNMDMAMDMVMFMAVDQTSVGVLMVVAVTMGMGVLQGNGVLHRQHSCPDHERKANIKPQARPLPQEQHSKQHPQKRGDGIIGTGFCRTQIFLSLDVKIDA